jgi:hypothetical protein
LYVSIVVVDNTTRSDKLYAHEAEQLIYAHNPDKPLYLQASQRHK